MEIRINKKEAETVPLNELESGRFFWPFKVKKDGVFPEDENVAYQKLHNDGKFIHIGVYGNEQDDVKNKIVINREIDEYTTPVIPFTLVGIQLAHPNLIELE